MWRGRQLRCIIFQPDFLPSVAVTLVLVKRRKAFTGAWKTLEPLVRVQEASETWNPQWWKESQLTCGNFQLLSTWLSWRRQGDIDTETHHILHTIKTGTVWPVISLISFFNLRAICDRPHGRLKYYPPFQKTSAVPAWPKPSAPRLRYSPGLAPTTRLNALLNAASDS